MNLIYVFADQLHGFALGCTENSDARTPHLDALAARGTVMHNTYSCAPVCTPARMTMWTGRYAGALGALDNDAAIPQGVQTLAGHFRKEGWLTSYVGKWHIGGTGNVPVPGMLRGGFERFAGFQCFNEFERDVCFFDEENRAIGFSGRHRTDATFDLAIQRLAEAVRDGRPFFLGVSEQAPHYPCQPAPEFYEPFRGRRMTRRPNSSEVDPYTPTFSPRSAPRDEDPVAHAYGNNLEEYLRRYHAAVSQVDAGMGRLLAAVEELGLSESTAVVFSSDHGDMQGSHGLKNKGMPFEESVRIPFIAAGPDIARGAVRDDLASTVDFFPTFAELCGLSAPNGLSGSSLAPLLRGEPGARMRPVFSEDRSGWCLVREGDWKFVSALDASSPLRLYNLGEDPCEINNLVGSNLTVQAHLADVLGEWRAANPLL